MASSRRTLDIDTLTYQDLYMKAQSGKQISSYTIPVIPGGSNVYKLFQYLTPEQLLSSGGLVFNTSTIPDISNAIINLAVKQSTLSISLSSLSTSAGLQISSSQANTYNVLSTVQGTTYNTAYETIISNYNILQGQNIQTLNLQRSILGLGISISTISSQFQPTFTGLSNILEITFNQGPAVSTLSTFFTNYYSNISANIQTYSTNVGYDILSTTIKDASTLVGYNIQIQTTLQNAAGPGVSTLSTFITSTLKGFNNTISIFDPTSGINLISSYVDDSISSLSSYFIIQAGVSGISSMSTVLARQYISSILNAQRIAGTPGLCTMSTLLTGIFRSTQQLIGISQGPTVSTLSTVLEKQLNLISTSLTTVGYTYIILQQEDVRNSLSTLSTSFQKNYNNLINLSTFSSILPNAYSTINIVFSLQTPYSTLQTLSTVEGSNISTTTQFISSVYPTIFCGPGLSSLSSSVNPNFSSISTGLAPVFTLFSNALNNGISSVRVDPGVSSLSTFLTENLGVFSTNYNILYGSFNNLSYTNQSIIQLYYNLSTTNADAYGSNNPAELIDNLNSTISTFSKYTTVNFSSLYGQTSNLSSYVSTTGQNFVSSYNTVRSTFFDTLENIVSSYTAISSIVESNIYSPTFSTFTTNIITLSNLTVNKAIYVSSLGIQTSTSTQYPFSMVGAAQILPSQDPSIHHIIAGLSNNLGNTTFINSTLSYTYKISPSDPGFSVGVNDIAYNGTTWIAVGSNTSGINSIKYTVNPSAGWLNAIIPSGSGLYGVNTVKWSGSYWLAGTSLYSMNLLISYDGINWSDASFPLNTQMDSLNALTWNGYNWVALGTNSNRGDAPFTNIKYTNANGVWQSATSNTTFSGFGSDIATNGRIWVAVGSGIVTMMYSSNSPPSTWTPTNSPRLLTANCVAWNGDKFVVGGSNGNSSNIMYSFTGVDWSYVNISELDVINTITWDGVMWNIAGSNTAGLQKILVSADAINWTEINPGVTTAKINTIAYSSNVTPSIQLSNFDIYSGNIPVTLNQKNRINVIHSTIYFNDGVLTIRKQDSPFQNIGNIGINTTYPQYALDIAIGNARKPAGTAWVNPSDMRIKTDIQPADLDKCAKIISEIPLRTYNFTKAFQEKTGADSNTQYGFIAQEVKQVLPQSIRYTNENGILDFHSLDTDQIFKLEFGATQFLLNTVQKLECQVSTLEARLN